MSSAVPLDSSAAQWAVSLAHLMADSRADLRAAPLDSWVALSAASSAALRAALWAVLLDSWAQPLERRYPKSRPGPRRRPAKIAARAPSSSRHLHPPYKCQFPAGELLVGSPVSRIAVDIWHYWAKKAHLPLN